MHQGCFALKGGQCQALTVTSCEGCSFYKSEAEFLRGQLQALVAFAAKKGDPESRVIYAAGVERYFGSERALQERITSLKEQLGGLLASA